MLAGCPISLGTSPSGAHACKIQLKAAWRIPVFTVGSTGRDRARRSESSIPISGLPSYPLQCTARRSAQTLYGHSLAGLHWLSRSDKTGRREESLHIFNLFSFPYNLAGRRIRGSKLRKRRNRVPAEPRSAWAGIGRTRKNIFRNLMTSFNRSEDHRLKYAIGVYSWWWRTGKRRRLWRLWEAANSDVLISTEESYATSS
jgi:hypothetical protein